MIRIATAVTLLAVLTGCSSAGQHGATHAPNEDGYLLEIKPVGQPQYRVAGFIDPDSTFTELTTLPTERTPSNLAHQTTGTD